MTWSADEVISDIKYLLLNNAVIPHTSVVHVTVTDMEGNTLYGSGNIDRCSICNNLPYAFAPWYKEITYVGPVSTDLGEKNQE